jgi:hypothetical protein
MNERYRFTATGSENSLGSDAADEFTGIESTLSGYGTFQQPIGSWIAMPGFRVERNTRHLSGPGQPHVSVTRTSLFPTLHVEHSLSKALDLTLSYSKRIDRPDILNLRPYPIVQDALTIKEGNPSLKDQSTDAYELNLHYRHKKIDAGVIIYDRETSRLWSEQYSVVNGVNVFTLINSGRRRDRGAEFDLSAPVVKRVKVSASVNLFDERTPVDGTAGTLNESTFRYTTNATLEWDGPDRGKIPGDVAQLQWIFESPSRQFQTHYLASNLLSLSYTHSFNRTVSLSGTLNYLSANRHRLEAPLVQEDYRSRSPVEFKVKLLKTFGISAREGAA